MQYRLPKLILVAMLAICMLMPCAQAEEYSANSPFDVVAPAATMSAAAVVSTPIVGAGVDLFNFDDTPQATPAPAINDVFGTQTSSASVNATAEFFGVDPSVVEGSTFQSVDGTDSTFEVPEALMNDVSMPSDELIDTGMFAGDLIVDDPFGIINATVSNEFGVTAGTAVIGGSNPFDGSPASAPVTANSTMYVSTSALPILREPQDTARAYGTAYFGQRLTIAATQGDWASVTNGKGATGYCHLSGLSASDPNTLSKTMYTQIKNTPIFTKPDKKAPKQRYVGQNQTVTVTAIATDGMWARVKNARGQAGFIPTIMLDDAVVSQGTQVWCASASTPVMVNPDQWTKITTLSFGQNCYLVSYLNNNTIAKIRASKGYVAYCAASALTTTNPATMNTPVYTQVSGKLLYKSAEDTSNRVDVTRNTQFALLGVDATQTWALVRASNNKLGYIPYIFLGSNRVDNSSYKVVVATQSTQIYKSTAMNAQAVDTVQIGTRMYLIGCAKDGIGAQVRTIANDTTVESEGYLPLKYLRGE